MSFGNYAPPPESENVLLVLLRVSLHWLQALLIRGNSQKTNNGFTEILSRVLLVMVHKQISALV